MSCYLIRVENGHKVARSITSEEEYKLIRGSYEQKANLRLAREGNDGAKRRLVQFNYSGHYPQGVVKGMKLPSRAFGFDLDDKQDFEKAAKLMLQEPEKYGLLMLERSARQGGHAVCKREMGKTILENQVRIAKMLECEMDTSAHDINRVYFTTSADAEDLLYLSPELFKDDYDEAAVAAEGKVLEEREKYGQEELPPGAHKANKHYKPWLENVEEKALDSQKILGIRIIRVRRTREISRILKRFNPLRILRILLRIRLSLLPLHHPLHLHLQHLLHHNPAMITSESRIPKSFRSGGRCIMTGMSQFAPTATL